MTTPPQLTYGGLPVLFTFLDRQFRYDCVACDAACCRVINGVFIRRDQEEQLAQLDEGACVSHVTADRFYVKFNEGGCPVLLEDGRCKLHVDVDRRAKPAVCATFPFTRLVHSGPFVVVSPQLGYVCPLTSDGRDGGDGTSHQEIIADLEHYYGGDLAPFVREPLAPQDPVDLDSEWQLVELADEMCGEATVSDVLCAAGTGRDELDARVGSALGLLDLPLPTETPEFAARLLPLLPSLRTELYRLPRAALATATVLGARLLANADRTRQSPLSSRQIATYLANRSEILALLAIAHLPVSLAGAAPEVERGGDDLTDTLADLLEQIAAHPAERSLAEWLSPTPGGTIRQVILNSLTQLTLSFG